MKKKEILVTKRVGDTKTLLMNLLKRWRETKAQCQNCCVHSGYLQWKNSSQDSLASKLENLLCRPQQPLLCPPLAHCWNSYPGPWSYHEKTERCSLDLLTFALKTFFSRNILIKGGWISKQQQHYSSSIGY